MCVVARGADLCVVARGADLCVVARINIVGRGLFDALLVNEIYTSFNESFEIEFCPDVNLCRRRFIQVRLTSPQGCYMVHWDELAFIIQQITIVKDRERRFAEMEPFVTYFRLNILFVSLALLEFEAPAGHICIKSFKSIDMFFFAELLRKYHVVAE